MANFNVPDGTDWIQPLFVGQPDDRWRLDDYDIAGHLKASDAIDSPILVDISTANGRLAITDPVRRRAEINVGWPLVQAAGVGPFVLDFLFVNKTTEVRERSERYTVTITRGVTYLPES